MKESRLLKVLEKENFLLFLVAGGGLISIINLSALIYLIVGRLQP